MVRYGIVGFGLHAIKRMIPGFQGAQNSQLIALSRRSMDAARECAQQYGVPFAFDSVEELCACPEVDAVFVATPNVCHLNDVLTAVRHGKAILCEKPMAMNADEGRQMVAAAREANVKLGVAQVFRFEKSVLHLRKRIAAGELGNIVMARSEFSYPGRSHPRKWINDRSQGGGVTADVGVHCIDALRFILQDEVIRVQAQMIRDAESGEVDAVGGLLLQFRHGTLASVMISMRAEYRTPLELVGERAVLSADNAFTVDRNLRVDLWRKGIKEESRHFHNEGAYSRMLDGFSGWIEGTSDFPAPGEEGVENQQILDAAYESARTGRIITLA